MSRKTQPPAPETAPQRPAWFAARPFRTDLPHAASVFLAAFALYAWTAPRLVTLEDDGLFAMACRFLSGAHPPGYPLHNLLGGLFAMIPIGGIAFRVHLLSGFLGALACALLWRIARGLGASRTASHAAALGLACSGTFWSQAIIAEVYTLNVLLFLLVFWFALRFRAEGGARALLAAAFCFGLCLSNHWPLAILSSPGLAPIVLPRWRELLRRLPACLLLVAAGLAPYLWLYLRSRAGTAVNFAGPMENVTDLWRFIARSAYDSAASSSATAADQYAFAGFALREMAAQFTLAGAALALLGFGVLLRRRLFQIAAALLLSWCGVFALIALLRMDYEFLNIAAFRVYPLIPYAMMALCLGIGIDTLRGRRLTAPGGRGPPGGSVKAMGIVIAACIVGATFLAHAKTNNRRDYTWADGIARLTLDTVEPHSALFLYGDLDLSPVGYTHLVEGVRPDVELYSTAGYWFTNRLIRPDREAVTLRAGRLADYLARTTNEVYYTDLFDTPHAATDMGLLNRVRRGGVPESRTFAVTEPWLQWIERMETMDISDPWTLYHRGVLEQKFGRLLTHLVYGLPADAPGMGRLRALQARICATPHGRLGILGVAETVSRERPEDLLRWAGELAARNDPTFSKEDRALIHRCKARVLLHLGRRDEGAAELERCIAIYPNPKNAGALQELAQLYASMRRNDLLQDLQRRTAAWSGFQIRRTAQ